jgi:hypothetical protein
MAEPKQQALQQANKETTGCFAFSSPYDIMAGLQITSDYEDPDVLADDLFLTSMLLASLKRWPLEGTIKIWRTGPHRHANGYRCLHNHNYPLIVATGYHSVINESSRTPS